MKTIKLERISVQILACTAILSLLTATFPAYILVAEAAQYPDDPSVDICHRTASDSNPYGPSTQTVNASSIVTGPNGHDTHNGPVWYEGIVGDWGDIIPPFDYDLGEGVQHYDGKNWDSEGQAIWNNSCQIPTVPTWDITLSKKFSGEDLGFTADQFSFYVSGSNSVDEVVAHGGSIELEAGSYTVSEVGPNGWDPNPWTIQWSGKSCENVTGESTTITLDESDENYDFDTCVADNQYKPGTIQVSKVVVGTSTAPENFSFTVNGGDAVSFESDGSNDIDVPAGDFLVEEVTASGYAVRYSDECSGTIANNGTASCVITNTYIENPVYGCTDPDADNYDPSANIDDGSCLYGGDGPTYLVFGYVWHDANSNTFWDGFQDEEATTTEDDLHGWTVEITNGSTTHSTTTDETGYYEFYVPVGTWTITELLQTGWSKTYPSNGHTVEVVGEAVTAAPGHIFLATLISKLIPVAHAQSATTYGPFNFGNVYTGTNGGGGGPSCTLSASRTSITSGENVDLSWTTTGATDATIDNGIGVVALDGATSTASISADVTYTLTASSGNNSTTCDVTVRISSTGGGGDGGSSSGGGGGGSSRSGGTPQVLGEQVSVVPSGAAAAGGGGASPAWPQTNYNLILWFGALTTRPVRKSY